MSMINTTDILETIKMIEEEHLDIRTITMGISLRDLASDDIHVLCDKIYDKITRRAEKLVATGESIERELGIPIINKRISVTPIAMIGAVTTANSYVPLARALDRAASATGVNFVGGFSALVQKGFAKAAWCGCRECEDKVKELYNASTRNMPFGQSDVPSDKCVLCGKAAEKLIYFAKAY